MSGFKTQAKSNYKRDPDVERRAKLAIEMAHAIWLKKHADKPCPACKRPLSA